MSAYDENHDAAPLRQSALLSDERRASVVTQLRVLMYQHANNQREPNLSGLCAVAANELEALGRRVDELTHCAGCKCPMETNRCEECARCEALRAAREAVKP